MIFQIFVAASHVLEIFSDLSNFELFDRVLIRGVYLLRERKIQYIK